MSFQKYIKLGGFALAAFLFLGLAPAQAQQDTVLLYVDSLGFSVDPMDEQLYTFPIRVRNFNDISGADLELRLTSQDGAVFDSVTLSASVDPGLSDFVVQNDSVASGLFIPSGESASIPDDSVFLNVTVRLPGGEGSCSSLSFFNLEVIESLDIVPSIGLGTNGLCVITVVNLSGSVVYASEAMPPLDNVELTATAASTDSTYTVLTGMADGAYIFTDVPAFDAYTVVPKDKIDVTDRLERLQGVNIGDVVTIVQHILGSNPFSSPYQYIAADVNQDGDISVQDLAALQSYLLFRTDELPGGVVWRFIDADYQFMDPSNPLSEPFPESISTQELIQNAEGLHFKAVKLGDANLSAY